MSKIYQDLSGRKGLAKKFAGDIVNSTGSPQYRYLANDGEMVQGEFNPIRRYGFLAPIPGTFTTVTENDATDNFTNEWRATVYDETNNLFFAGESGNLIWKGNAGATVLSGVPGGGALITAAAATRITDMEIYQLDGVKNLFVSYTKAGGGDILISSIVNNPSSYATDPIWLSNAVAGAIKTGATNDVFMRVADNGYMYIFDGNAIHKLNGKSAAQDPADSGGTNGTLTPNVIVFPTGFYLTDAVDWRGNMWCAVQTGGAGGLTSGTFATTSNESRIIGVYVWNKQTAIGSSVDFIPMRGVKDIRKLYITQEGELRAIVVSSQRLVQIRKYNGSSFEVVCELGTVAFPNYRDSVGQLGQLTVWFGWDGIIYAHGKIAPGEEDGLFILGDTTATMGEYASNGAIIILDNNGVSTAPRDGILWSSKANAGTMYNRYLYPHSIGGSPLAGNVYAPVKMLPKLSTINYVNVFCSPTASAAATAIATVKIFTNMSTTVWKTHTVTMAQASRGYVNIPIQKPFCNSIQIEVVWDTGNTIGTSDFLPMYAEIDYTPTDTSK